MGKNIYLTQADYQALHELISSGSGSPDGKYLGILEQELRRAVVVSEQELPGDVVTINSEVRLKNLNTGKTAKYRLVMPEKADADKGKISVLAPIGTALVGEKKGEVIEWEVPSGRVKIVIEAISRPH